MAGKGRADSFIFSGGCQKREDLIFWGTVDFIGTMGYMFLDPSKYNKNSFKEKYIKTL